jgi:hypothetical protein
MSAVPLHIREQATACIIIAGELGDVDGEPSGGALPEDQFPHVQDVVNHGACKSAGDFNAKFIGVVAYFYAYHGVIKLGESFRSTGSEYSNSEATGTLNLNNSEKDFHLRN